MARRALKITGTIDNDSYRKFSFQLDALIAKSHKPIEIELCSEGGDSYFGLAFYARIKTCGCPVTIKAYGHVMSAATVILLAGNIRQMHGDCWFMIHDDDEDMDTRNTRVAINSAKHMDNLEIHWAEIMARHTDITVDMWREMSDKTTYLTALQCKKFGVIHEIFG